MLNIPAQTSFTTPEGYTVAYVNITPALAASLLAANTNNRNVKTRNLDKIGQDMLAGRWIFNGDAIRIDDNDVIIDGQHRLLQIEKTGITVPALIVSGLPSAARATIDTNSIRSAADELKMQGYQRAHQLAAIAGAYLRYQKLGLRPAIDSTVTTSKSTSTSQIVAEIKANPLLEKLTKTVASHHYKQLTGTMGSILYWRFKLAEQTPGDADFFFERLRDGVGLAADSPILKLRTLLDQMHDKKTQRATPTLIAALTIKAWNAYQQGAPVKSLKYRTGGANPERFPEIG